MATEAQIVLDIAALEAQIRTTAGVGSTSFGDQSISFDLAGARARLAELQRQLSVAQGTPRNVRYAQTRKGV